MDITGDLYDHFKRSDGAVRIGTNPALIVTSQIRDAIWVDVNVGVADDPMYFPQKFSVSSRGNIEMKTVVPDPIGFVATIVSMMRDSKRATEAAIKDLIEPFTRLNVRSLTPAEAAARGLHGD